MPPELKQRLFGELVKDAESWLSIGIMNTKENIDNDFYYQYKNAAGEIITSQSTDQVTADSVQTDVVGCAAQQTACSLSVYFCRIIYPPIKILKFT